MQEKLRETAVDVLGGLPWGTHLCLFYHTPEDLVDILVPYFRAGLESNELCMWVTSGPLSVEEARRSLERAVDSLHDYVAQGQMEILDYREWYTPSGRFEADEVLQGWLEKEKQALKRGFQGLRVAANISWLGKEDWGAFRDYEGAADRVIGQHRMLIICAYCLDRCGASELIDVVNNHQFALIRREGEWEAIEDAERKRAEQALRASARQWQSTFDAISDAVCLMDAEGRILRCNRAMLNLLGRPPGEIVGRACWELVHGTSGPIEGCPVTRMRQSHCRETSLLSMDDRWISVTADPVLDEAGRLVGAVHTMADITDRKRMEERVRAQDRLAAVGQLAAGVAHDFNNILTGMIGYAQLVNMRGDVPQAVKADVKSIIDEGQRAAHLIRQILDFSRRSPMWPRSLNLAPFLEEAVEFLRRIIPESIGIVLGIGAGECWVRADPAQMRQVLANLAANAQEAMPGGGEMRFGLSRLLLEPGDRSPCPDMGPGEWIRLSVSDTGVGIRPEIVPHLYEPFFTTKWPPEGAGLGLAQVYGIVKRHRGFIDLETEVGRGTTFTLYLPLVAVEEEALREKAPEEAPRGEGELILVVEDEPQVLRVSRALLEHLGYRVLTAATGGEALEVYEEQGEEIALVLADMVMPQMGAVQLFEALRARDPEVKMVVMTGYLLGGAEDRELVEKGIVDWVLKPLALDELARVVRRGLE